MRRAKGIGDNSEKDGQVTAKKKEQKITTQLSNTKLNDDLPLPAAGTLAASLPLAISRTAGRERKRGSCVNASDSAYGTFLGRVTRILDSQKGVWIACPRHRGDR